MKLYGDNLRISPPSNSTDIYSYLNTTLKHMPKDTLKTLV